MVDLLTVACDESASEGETLMGSQHPVFVHGSVQLEVDEAERFLSMVRSLTGIRANELKSKHVLKPQYRSGLIAALQGLYGHANIYLVDKSYFLIAKLIVLLPAELAARDNLQLNEEAPKMAHTLHRLGPSAVSGPRWAELLQTFNDVIRSYARAESAPPPVGRFFDALNEARTHCADRRVQDILDRVWDARHLTQEYEGVSPAELRELDPMFPSLFHVAHSWRTRLGDVPFEFLADEYWGLTGSARAAIVDLSRSSFGGGGPGGLRRIRTIDSRRDARVQVADIVAGAGREVASSAMEGIYDDPLQQAVQPMIDHNMMVSAGSALERLRLRPRPIPLREDR